MKHQSKQVLAWVIAFGASSTLFGAGSWAVKKMAARAAHGNVGGDEHDTKGDHGGHDQEGEEHAASEHGSARKGEEHGDAHASADHGSEHKDKGHGEKHAADHGGEHKADGHGEKHASADHGSEHKDEGHGEKHAADHGGEHKADGHGETHAAADHGTEHKKVDHGEKHAAADHGGGHKAAGHGEKKDAHKGAAHWSYARDAAEGPNSWGKFSPDFAACEKGREQSPINITGTHRSAAAPKLNFHYAPTATSVENNGHTIQATMPNDQNYVLIDDEKFNLAQFHFHSPSEHRIGGVPADMELHFVHKNKTGKLAVVGVLINEKSKGENRSFKSLWDLLPRDFGTKAESQPTMNLLSMLPKHRDYYNYAGSLTTPPCSEGVRWFVMKEPIAMSAGQVDAYHSIFGGNTNRPVQPVFTRQIMESIGPTDVAH